MDDPESTPLKSTAHRAVATGLRAKTFPRRPPRLLQSGDSSVWFVTFCTYRREPWLAAVQVHSAFVVFATAAQDFNIAVGRYVIMPDHVHLFVCGGQDFVLSRWVGQLKQALAKAAERSAVEHTPWQEGFFDHLLRSDESMSQKWDYIGNNPVRASLVKRAEDWPYQGEIITIDRA